MISENMSNVQDIFVNSSMYPGNFYQENENKNDSTTEEQSSPNLLEKVNKVDKENLFTFLNTKPTTILAFATAFAVGFALKDFVGAFVQSIFQPLLMNIIMFVDSNNYLPITNLIREKNPQIDIAKFLGSVLTVKIVIILLYLMNKYENLFLF
jgi:large-conductance mechanosensitive channel